MATQWQHYGNTPGNTEAPIFMCTKGFVEVKETQKYVLSKMHAHERLFNFPCSSGGGTYFYRYGNTQWLSRMKPEPRVNHAEQVGSDRIC